MSNPLIEATDRQGWPLCCTYFLVLFESVVVEVEANACARSPRLLRWALGVLSSGEYEVVGGWPESPTHGLPWDQVFAELKGRGVERVRFVIAGDLAADESAMLVDFPNAISLPVTMELRTLNAGRLARLGEMDGAAEMRTPGAARKARTKNDALAGSGIRASKGTFVEGRRSAGGQAPIHSFAMSAGCLRRVLAAQRAAQALQRHVGSAVARHGAFSGPATATAFVVDALIRAEQITLNAKPQAPRV